MIVRFLLPDGRSVEYDYGQSREPVAGDFIRPDGSDPDFPVLDGFRYRVEDVTQEITVRGPRVTICQLRLSVH